VTSRISISISGLLLISWLGPARLWADAGQLPNLPQVAQQQRLQAQSPQQRLQPQSTPSGNRRATTPAPAVPASKSSASRRITRVGDEAQTTEGRPARGISPAGSLWTTFGSLLILIAVILIAARLWKRHLPSVGGLLSGDVIELLGRKPIDQKRQLQLIRIGSRILVVGTWAEGMVTLTEITDPSEVDCIAGLCQDSTPGLGEGTPFANLFRRNSPDTAPVQPSTATSTAARFQMPPRPEIDVQAS